MGIVLHVGLDTDAHDAYTVAPPLPEPHHEASHALFRLPEHERTAVIVGDHPIIGDLTDKDLGPGVRIGINRACKHPRIRWDVLSCKDGPRDRSTTEHLWMEHLGMLPGSIVWGRSFHLAEWEQFYPGLIYELSDPYRELWRRFNSMHWLQGTVFFTIGRAVQAGAQRIRLFGVEMQGTGNFAHFLKERSHYDPSGTDGKGEGEDPTNNRWSAERLALSRTYRELRPWGVEFDRVSLLRQRLLEKPRHVAAR